MFNFLITNAYAQGVANTVRSTAAAGTDAATGKAQAGLQGLISYVLSNLDNWIAGVAVVALFYLLARMASAAIKEAIIKEKEDIQESALILIERVTRMTVLVIGVTIAFAINGLNFTAVIGALSLGIGFALKDIIGNFISGVIMLAQDRIKIGDFIKVENTLGTIVGIDTRATILQAIDGTEVVIPNQTMLSQTLISYSTNPFRRVELLVGVDYKTDLPMVTSLIKGVIDKDKDCVVMPKPMILVNEFGDSSINIKIFFWVESGSDWQSIRSNIANKVKKAFDELGVSIPFPITTLKLDENDHAFLSTMDSMKKGVVPNQPEAITESQIETAAMKTAAEKSIPYKIFKEQAKPKPATNTVPPAAPAPATPVIPVVPTAPASTPAPEVKTTVEKPLAPPSHL